MRLLKITILTAFIAFSAACLWLSANKNAPVKNHHAQTLRKATAENVKGDFERENRFEFVGVRAEMSQKGTDFFISFETPNQKETYTIEAVVGTEKLEEYIARKDGKLVRLPIAYDLKVKSWINLNTTFFETDGADFFKYQTDWETNCASCHLENSAQNIPTNCAACHSKNLHESETDAIQLSSREHQGILRSVCFVKNKGGEVINCLSCHSSENNKAPTQQSCINCHQQFSAPEAVAQHTKHQTDSANCFSCHQPEIVYGHLEFQKTHEISIPKPELTALKAVPNACNLCHTDKSVNWAITNTKTLWTEHFRDAEISNDPQFDEAEGIRALFAGDAFTRALAADTLTKRSAPEWFTPFALEAFEDENYPIVRYFLTNALGKNPNPSTRETLDQQFPISNLNQTNRIKAAAQKLRSNRKSPDIQISD